MAGTFRLLVRLDSNNIQVVPAGPATKEAFLASEFTGKNIDEFLGWRPCWSVVHLTDLDQIPATTNWRRIRSPPGSFNSPTRTHSNIQLSQPYSTNSNHVRSVQQNFDVQDVRVSLILTSVPFLTLSLVTPQQRPWCGRDAHAHFRRSHFRPLPRQVSRLLEVSPAAFLPGHH
jgi:hypothetical protein